MRQREIKFRAWDTAHKSWYFYGEELNSLAPEIMELNKETQFSWKDIVLQQFTGLKDKNGKEIYEGDILRQLYMGNWIIAPMIWNEAKAQFGMDAVVEDDGIPSHIEIVIPKEQAPEIIGNIYENPDLLK